MCSKLVGSFVLGICSIGVFVCVLESVVILGLGVRSSVIVRWTKLFLGLKEMLVIWCLGVVGVFFVGVIEG